MGKVLAKTTVEDFDRFIETFRTRGAEHRKAFGSTGATVLRSRDDANEVWVLFDWEPERFLAFVEDDEARELFRAAGLQRPPEPTFVEQVGQFES